jgi:hypothetical protein
MVKLEIHLKRINDVIRANWAGKDFLDVWSTRSSMCTTA